MMVFSILAGVSELGAQPSLFSHEKYINATADTLNYRLLISDADTVSRYPLVVFLHGAGERGSDNEAQLKWGVKNFADDQIMKNYRPIVVVPQCPENMSWGNYSYDETLMLEQKPTATKPLALVMELIDQLITDLPVDPNRIYITGLSMGGIGTFDAISLFPNKFAAAVPVCGAGDISKAQIISGIPLWIFQGALDPVVSPQYGRDMFETLTDLGARPGFTEYPETGHFVWIAAYSDPMMLNWLFRQRK